jgi:hypothetical protein
MVERWTKLAEQQMKVATVPSGFTFHPPHAKAQPNVIFWANANVVVKDGEIAGNGKGADLLESALEEAEEARKGLEEENRKVKGVVVECANRLARVVNSVRARSGRGGSEVCVDHIVHELGSSAHTPEASDLQFGIHVSELSFLYGKRPIRDFGQHAQKRCHGTMRCGR